MKVASMQRHPELPDIEVNGKSKRTKDIVHVQVQNRPEQVLWVLPIARSKQHHRDNGLPGLPLAADHSKPLQSGSFRMSTMILREAVAS